MHPNELKKMVCGKRFRKSLERVMNDESLPDDLVFVRRVISNVSEHIQDQRMLARTQLETAQRKREERVELFFEWLLGPISRLPKFLQVLLALIIMPVLQLLILIFGIACMYALET